MINPVEKAISAALQSEGDTQQANKAYLEFIKANFIVPVEKNADSSDPRVLFLEENGAVFLPVFTDIRYLETWGQDIQEEVALLHLSGVDLLKGIGEAVIVCLNPGSDIYKEFNPSELARMRSMVLKIFKNQ